MKPKLIVLLLSLIVVCSVTAQNTRFYNANTIGSNWYNDICQDDEDYIWIAAYYGLYRFDGTYFKTYLHNESDSTSLSDNMARSLLLDNDKRLWVGTANGLQYYSPEFDNFKHIKFSDGIANQHIIDILQRHNGEIWFTVSGGGIYRVDHKNDTAVKVPGTEMCNGKYVTRIYEDLNDNIWVGTDREGVIRIDHTTGEANSYCTDGHNIHSIIEDSEGHLFVVSRTAIMVWDQSSMDFKPLDQEGSAFTTRSAALANNGAVWLNTYGKGIKYISPKDMKIHSQTDVNTPFFDINKAKITAMFKDKDENMWLGCAFQGILMVPKQKLPFNFWDFSLKQTGESGEIKTLYCDREGSIWGSIESGGIYKFANNGEVVLHIDTPMTVSCFYEDSDGNFWVGTDRGLYVLDKKTERLSNIQLYGKKDVPIQSIIEDRDKNLYIILSGIGVLRHNLDSGRNKIFTSSSSEEEKLVNNWANKILCDSKGLIWTGHYNGISCYDPSQDRFLNVNDNPILSQSICFALLQSADDKIWIGTNNGLFRYDPNTKATRRFTTVDGLSNNTICGLAEDGRGGIWCSTMQGLNRIQTDGNVIENYYSGNGLIDRTYTCGVYAKGDGGRIYFGGNMGITSFMPEEITQTGFDRPPHITGLLINGSRSVNLGSVSGKRHVIDENLSSAKRIRLSYLDNTFTLIFSTMDFRESGNVSYEYRLKNANDTWNKTLPGDNRITYNNLIPGHYQLEVRASENGVHSDAKQIGIDIAPPWYQSVFAQVIYSILLVALAIFIYFTLKRKRQEEISEAKLQFFINISHDMRSPLTLILSPLESLLKKDYDDETSHALHVMHRNAIRIISLINQLLDIRKIDKGHMNIHCSETDLVSYSADILKIFEYQAQKRHISLSFINHYDEIKVWIDRNNFDKVLINLLQNAFKYTPEGGEITLSINTGNDKKLLDSHEGYAEIAVTDSGMGLNEAEMDKIFDRFYQSDSGAASTPMGFGIGLNFCRLLVNLHHGTISASNRKDAKGSCFTIRIPLGNSHLRASELAVSQPSELKQLIPELTKEDGDTDRGKQYKKERNKTRYSVLVVDDDEELRSFLKDELSQLYKVVLATNGAEGMAIAINQMPDVIVSDIMMPEMDGLTMLKRLKTNGNTNHIPIIMLTSKSEFEDRISGLEKGADGYLSKPFSTQELNTLIANTITNHIRLKGKYSGMQSQEGRIKTIELKSEDEKLMDKVITVINDNIDNPELSVEMLAKEVGISRVQLHRRLKGLTGIATSDFIRNIRLKQAAEMLASHKSNISQIAYAVGFSSQSHFSTAFKKFYGVSPSEYADSGDKAQ